MKVLIENLYKDYNYSDQVEEYIGELIGNKFGLKYEGQTHGFNPAYDFILKNKKIEVKFTSAAYPAIEFARGNLKPSGLLLSEADYYLIVSPGGSKNQFVGKVRLYKRIDLLEKFIHVINNPLTSDIRTYPVTDNSPGAICFTINPQDINDIWLGDCDLILDGRRVIGFDLGSIKFTRKTLAI